MDSIVYNDYFPLPTVVYHCLRKPNIAKTIEPDQAGPKRAV